MRRCQGRLTQPRLHHGLERAATKGQQLAQNGCDVPHGPRVVIMSEARRELTQAGLQRVRRLKHAGRAGWKLQHDLRKICTGARTMGTTRRQDGMLDS